MAVLFPPYSASMVTIIDHLPTEIQEQQLPEMELLKIYT